MTASRQPGENGARYGWQAVIFDVEGVIARQDETVATSLLAGLRPGLTAEELRRARDSEILYPLWLQYSIGQLAPRVYWSSVLSALGIAPTGEAIERLREIQRRTWWAVVDRQVVDLIRRLRAQPLRLATLSNSAPEHEGQLAALEPLFDRMHYSHRTGYRKPDALAFLHLLDELGTPVGQTVFVDDKERNVAAAQALGMTGIVFQDANHLRAELERLAVLVQPPEGRA